jgi:GNAT superfamily N-acetyltransferase
MGPAAGRTIRIREMTGYDVAPLAEALSLPTYSMGRRWSETLAGFIETYVADVDGKPAGSVSIDEHKQFRGLPRLFALDVAPPLRDGGIGTRLIEYVEGELRNRGYAGVYLDVSVENDGARRLYERLGYVQDGQPFVSSWNRYDGEGNLMKEVTDTFFRMVKRFG